MFFQHLAQLTDCQIVFSSEVVDDSDVCLNHGRERVECLCLSDFTQSVDNSSQARKITAVTMVYGCVIWVERQGTLKFAFRIRPLPVVVREDISERRVCFCQRVVKLQSPGGGGFGLRKNLVRKCARVEREHAVVIGKSCVCGSVQRIFFHSLLEIISRLAQVLRLAAVPIISTSQISIVRLGIDGTRRLPQPRSFLLCQLDANLVSHRLSHLALQTQNVPHIRFVAFSPKMLLRRGLY